MKRMNREKQAEKSRQFSTFGDASDRDWLNRLQLDELPVDEIHG